MVGRSTTRVNMLNKEHANNRNTKRLFLVGLGVLVVLEGLWGYVTNALVTLLGFKSFSIYQNATVFNDRPALGYMLMLTELAIILLLIYLATKFRVRTMRIITVVLLSLLFCFGLFLLYFNYAVSQVWS